MCFSNKGMDKWKLRHSLQKLSTQSKHQKEAFVFLPWFLQETHKEKSIPNLKSNKVFMTCGTLIFVSKYVCFLKDVQQKHAGQFINISLVFVQLSSFCSPIFFSKHPLHKKCKQCSVMELWRVSLHCVHLVSADILSPWLSFELSICDKLGHW